MSQISWKHDGKRILLPVSILRADNPSDLTSVPAMALVDTGATVSGIDQKIADALGLHPIGKRPVHTAHGLGQIDRYLFRIGLVPDGSQESALPFIFDEIYGLGLSGSEHFTALIGMDILHRCDFSIDRHRNCRLVLV